MFQRRRCSFGAAAGEYERFRPGYPAEAVAWLTGPRRRRVLDVGAGTGKLTRIVSELGHDVVAVEPDDRLREALTRSLPAVEVLAGSAEQLPVPDGSFDLVVAAQAFHWFELPRALPEFARALSPGGHLGVLWNLRDESVPWVAELGAILHAGDGEQSSIAANREHDWSPWFGPVERASFVHRQELDLESLVGLASSRSYVLTLQEPDRGVLLEQVAALARRELDGSPGGLLRLPYVTSCLRAERRLERAEQDSASPVATPPQEPRPTSR